MKYPLIWLPLLGLSLALRPATPGPPPKARRLTAAQVPSQLKPPGQVLEAWRWLDANGENTLVISRTAVRPEPKPGDLEGEQYRELYARQYVRQAAQYKELWRLYDANRHCWTPELGPLAGATTVTDLDGDGHSETTIIYKLACRTDTSPASLKLIMHEDAKKYALRGQMIQLINYPTEAEKKKVRNKVLCCGYMVDAKADDAYEQLEGLFETDKDFIGTPPAFLKFARQQWWRWRTRDSFEEMD